MGLYGTSNFWQNLFSKIACCSSLNFSHVGDLASATTNGVYNFGGQVSEMDFWVQASGEFAIWYITTGDDFYWVVGPSAEVGSFSAAMYTVSDLLEKKCPNNEGYVWNWRYNNGVSWIETNDVHIKCTNEGDFCTSQNPCGTDQGDCDIHDECQMGLICGSNNCPESALYNSDTDCCYAPPLGDEYFCTSQNLCAVDEGDCDSHDECQMGLICGSNKCPKGAAHFNADTDCCFNATIGEEFFCSTVKPCGDNEGRDLFDHTHNLDIVSRCFEKIIIVKIFFQKCHMFIIDNFINP